MDESKRIVGDMSTAGYGKLILFGEHFVVYKVPALVGAVAACTTCSVELSDAEWSHGLILEDNRPAVPGYKAKKCDEMLGGTRLVLEHFGIDTAKRGATVYTVDVVTGRDLDVETHLVRHDRRLLPSG